MEFKKFDFKKIYALRSSMAFGVDFNERKIRLMQLKKDGKHKKMGGWAERKIPQGVVDSMLIVKKEDFKNLFFDAVKQSTKKIKGNKIVVSIPENKIFTRIITIPLMDKSEAGESVRFETEANIPISVDEVYFDWQIVKKRKKDMDILIVASPVAIIDNYLEVFKGIGYEVVAFEPKSISNGRSVISADSQDYVLVVDMGLETTNLAIYEKGFPIFTSSGSISGKSLTDMIMKNKGISTEKAESYKIKVGLGSTSEEKQESFAILESALVTIVEEIKRTLNFFNETLVNQRSKDKNKEKMEIKEIILTGGGSNLRGLNSYLSINLQETIEQANPWLNVRFKGNIPPVSKEDSQGFSTVIGLALRAEEYENYN
ncbi:MAG: type IV pilus assembly protein PilM [Patescibacteria group bacterium]|jgi:type IV pilus assembly protein PilM|nr:type IV pilus assembly protein PilM [Patescibacteria group bacterium]